MSSKGIRGTASSFLRDRPQFILPLTAMNSIRQFHSLAIAILLAAFCCHSAEAQTTAVVQNKWRIGVTITGGNSPIKKVMMTLPLPNNWPEQRVALLEEQIPDIAQVKFRNLKSGVRQMLIYMPQLGARQKVTIAVVLDVETNELLEPEDRSRYLLAKTSHKEGKQYLGSSSYVNHRNSKLRRFAKELVADETDPWKQVELIYDWVRDNIENLDGRTQDAVTTFLKKEGNNEDRIFLFVAMCRSIKIPARIVFANEFNYAEFMLTDKEGKHGYWMPCNINGVREFGSLAEPKIILQKGDSIRVPEKEKPQKYVAEFLSCQGKSRPSVRFFREVVEDNADE